MVTFPSVNPNNTFSPNAWKNVILPKPKIPGTSQFQSSCTGQAKTSDHTTIIKMAIADTAVKDRTDSYSYFVFIAHIFCGRGGIRTHDIDITSVALYH